MTSTTGSYARLYRQAREAIEKEAERLLGRSLTRHERNLFRNCGTLSKLEELGMQMYYAESGEAFAATLATLSLEPRFLLAIDELTPRLERMLQRPLTPTETRQLRQLEHIEALWQLEYLVQTAPPNERSKAFSHALKQPLT